MLCAGGCRLSAPNLNLVPHFTSHLKRSRGSLRGLLSRRFCLFSQRCPPLQWFPRECWGSQVPFWGICTERHISFMIPRITNEEFSRFYSALPSVWWGFPEYYMMWDVISNWNPLGECRWLIQARHEEALQQWATSPHLSLDFSLFWKKIVFIRVLLMLTCDGYFLNELIRM